MEYDLICNLYNKIKIYENDKIIFASVILFDDVTCRFSWLCAFGIGSRPEIPVSRRALHAENKRRCLAWSKCGARLPAWGLPTQPDQPVRPCRSARFQVTLFWMQSSLDVLLFMSMLKILVVRSCQAVPNNVEWGKFSSKGLINYGILILAWCCWMVSKWIVNCLLTVLL